MPIKLIVLFVLIFQLRNLNCGRAPPPTSTTSAVTSSGNAVGGSGGSGDGGSGGSGSGSSNSGCGGSGGSGSGSGSGCGGSNITLVSNNSVNIRNISSFLNGTSFIKTSCCVTCINLTCSLFSGNIGQCCTKDSDCCGCSASNGTGKCNPSCDASYANKSCLYDHDCYSKQNPINCHNYSIFPANFSMPVNLSNIIDQYLAMEDTTKSTSIIARSTSMDILSTSKSSPIISSLVTLTPDTAAVTTSQRVSEKSHLSCSDQLGIIGRANIEAQRIIALAKIETRRKEALRRLDIEYAIADKVRKSFGFIGIISINALASVIILNDLLKLANLFYELYEQSLEERKKTIKIKEKKLLDEERERQESIQIEMDRAYSLDLEKKLETFHVKLIKAVAASKLNSRKNTF